MKEGFIFLHRKIADWSWYHDSGMVHLFIHCLLKANYEPAKFRDKEILRGQFVTGLKSLEQQTGMSIQTIRTCLAHLKSTGEITVWSTTRFSIITICNYEDYQSPISITNKRINKHTNKQPTNEQQTTNKQLTTIKEDNNIISKEEKETNNSGSEFFSFENFWKLYDKNINEHYCRHYWEKEITAADKEQISLRLPAYIEATPDKKFRKDPLHYLDEKGWLNEIVKPAGVKKEKSAIDRMIDGELEITIKQA